MNKRPAPLFLLIFSFFVTTSLSSQVILGWSGGYAPDREINRNIYVYNTINTPGLTKQMPEMHYYQGPVVGFRAASDDGYLELLWNRKWASVSSEFDSSGVPMQRELRSRVNTFNWGGAYSIDGWSAGMSFDFGFCKGMGKRAAKDGFKDRDYEWLWTPEHFLRLVNRILPDGNTIWIERDLGKFAAVRIYAQMFWIATDLTSEKSGNKIDYWFFGSELNYANPMVQRFNNYGLEIFLKLGKS
ncbi:MAG TPA: hypothetical protein VL651_13880 [Bacteroidia bacterium]|jgi:hypothetical protein|nr:hypothetical protein [Bacteroidia bacterium]